MTTLQFRIADIYNIAKTVGRFTIANGKPQYSGVLLDASQEGIFAVATDGHRIGKMKLTPLSPEGQDNTEYTFQHLLPPEVVKWCGALKFTRSTASTIITVDFKDSSVTFTSPGTTATFRLMEEIYPDWRRYMPDGNEFSSRIAFSIEYLKDVCEAVKTYSDSRYPGLEIAFDHAGGPAVIRGSKDGFDIILMPMRLGRD